MAENCLKTANGKAWNGKDWKIVKKTCDFQYLFTDIFKCKKNNGYCDVLIKKCFKNVD